jgi:hypothetical protein
MVSTCPRCSSATGRAESDRSKSNPARNEIRGRQSSWLKFNRSDWNSACSITDREQMGEDPIEESIRASMAFSKTSAPRDPAALAGALAPHAR